MMLMAMRDRGVCVTITHWDEVCSLLTMPIMLVTERLIINKSMVLKGEREVRSSEGTFQ